MRERRLKLKVEPRLERLVQSGLCETGDTKKYREILRSLVGRTSGGEDLKSQAALFGALGDEIRLKMMYALLSREMCECEIMVALGLTQPTTSHHLSILARAGLVKRTRRGKWAFYRASSSSLEGHIRAFVGSVKPE